MAVPPANRLIGVATIGASIYSLSVLACHFERIAGRPLRGGKTNNFEGVGFSLSSARWSLSDMAFLFHLKVECAWWRLLLHL